MSDFTQGPWDFGPGYEPGDSTFDLFAPGGRQVIARASYENMWLSAYDKATDAANARLIAAAPDLLEAASGLLAADDLTKSGDDVAAMLAFGKAWEDMRAAIAKAVGQ